MSEGYGHDWTRWDEKLPWQRSAEGVKYKGELTPLPNACYGNFYPFRSPKGRWMAFHNKYYSDIRIIDLKTYETVFEQFYRTPTYYASHTNFCTYVPGYMSSMSSDGKTRFFYNDHELDEDKDWDNFEEDIGYLPIAFNAWTIWACDYEFYVDILDLRQIDDGILKIYENKTSFIIPRSAGHVRNYVNVQLEWNDDDDKVNPVPIAWDIPYLEEKQKFRFYNGEKGFKFYDMYQPKEPFNMLDEIPAVINERRWNEREEARRVEKSKTNVQDEPKDKDAQQDQSIGVQESSNSGDQKS